MKTHTKQLGIFDKESQLIARQDFIRRIGKLLAESEVSWFITDSRSFEWADINLNKKKFLNDVSSLKFKKAFVGVFDRNSKQTEYLSFKLK